MSLVTPDLFFLRILARRVSGCLMCKSIPSLIDHVSDKIEEIRLLGPIFVEPIALVHTEVRNYAAA